MAVRGQNVWLGGNLPGQGLVDVYFVRRQPKKKNNNASTCRGLQFPQRMNDLVESLSIYSGLILNVKKDSSLLDFCRALLHLFPICVLSNMTSGLV